METLLDADEPRAEGGEQRAGLGAFLSGAGDGTIQKTTEKPDPLRQRLCHGGRGESKRQEIKRPSWEVWRISNERRSIYGTSRWIGVDDPDGATALLPMLGTGLRTEPLMNANGR